MIIGNGAIGEGVASLANASDLVVRFNLCGSFGSDDRRCDVVAVCNTGRPAKAMVGAPAWRAHPAVQKASEIWSVRDAHTFDAMKPDVLARHPELDDFFEDFTADFAKIAAEDSKFHQVISRDVHEGVDAELSKLTDAPYVCPSSGLVTIAHILKNVKEAGDEVRIAGFTHQGWELHPFEAEKRLIDRWVASGDLIRV